MSDQSERSSGPEPISFSLAPRLLINGELSIVLHLYRDGRLAVTSTLMTCSRQNLSDALDLCRTHLRKLGVKDARGRSLPESAVWPGSHDAAIAAVQPRLDRETMPQPEPLEI